MTSIEKQVQATQKRIDAFEQGVQMYASRADKQIAKLQSAGYGVTRDDFRIEKSGRWKYDYDYTVSDRVKEMLTFAQWQPIVNNLLMEREKTDRLANERKHLDKLMAGQKQKADAVNELAEKDRPLIKALTAALEPFRVEWTNQMLDWHDKFYDRIHGMLDNARQQYHSLKQEIDKELRANGFRPTPRYKQLQTALTSFGRILSAPPAAYNSKEAYIENIRPQLKQEFEQSIAVLAEKCRKFDLDIDKVRVHHPRMSERGFDLILRDGKDRVIDARMIWAAENSEIVTTHTRYIVTEKMISNSQEKDNKIKKETMMTTDNWKERIDWNAYRKEVEGSISNEKLWSMGGGEESGLHQQNLEELTEELEDILKGNYNAVIDKYVNYMGEEDARNVFADFLKKENPRQKKDDVASRITDINVYSGRDGSMFIRCRIDGEQQQGKKLGFRDTVNFDDRTDRMKLAAVYFKQELSETLEEKQERGLKR